MTNDLGATKQKLTIALALLLAALAQPRSSAAGARPEGWDRYNNPSLILPAHETRLGALPLDGGLSGNQVPWSDSYWPNINLSIAYRWNWKSIPLPSFRAPMRSDAHRFSRAQLAVLSPAEKYDLFLGHYDYPLTSRVRARIGRLQELGSASATAGRPPHWHMSSRRRSISLESGRNLSCRLALQT